jgi:transcriptional regulator with XRE-family HTH domain
MEPVSLVLGEQDFYFGILPLGNALRCFWVLTELMIKEVIEVLKELGEQLRRAREVLRWELEDVRERTKIQVKYLKALEEGVPELIPAEVYFKGMLKTYADCLGLDGYLFVQRYKRWVMEKEQEFNPVTEENGVLCWLKGLLDVERRRVHK